MAVQLNQHNQKGFMKTSAHAFLQMKRTKSSSQYIDNKVTEHNFSIYSSVIRTTGFLKTAIR